MNRNKPITILLVEDDENDCLNMKNYIDSREDVKLVDIVNSPEKAIESIKTSNNCPVLPFINV